MAYNPDKAKETPVLPAGERTEGVVINVEDGTGRIFVRPEVQHKWKGSLDDPAIRVHFEGKYNEQKIICQEIFNYISTSEGIEYKPNSKLASFLKAYGSLPKTGVKVKLDSDGKGFWQLFLAKN